MIEVNYDVFKPKSVYAAPRFEFQWLKNEDLDNLDYTIKKVAAHHKNKTERLCFAAESQVS